jgi:hypothetical protein
MARHLLVGHSLLFLEASWFLPLSHSHTHTLTHTLHPVDLLWTRDRPVAETSTWQHTTIIRDTDILALDRIRSRNPSKRAAAEPHLKSLGHRNRQLNLYASVEWVRDFSVTYKVHWNWASVRSIFICVGLWWIVMHPLYVCFWADLGRNLLNSSGANVVKKGEKHLVMAAAFCSWISGFEVIKIDEGPKTFILCAV